MSDYFLFKFQCPQCQWRENKRNMWWPGLQLDSSVSSRTVSNNLPMFSGKQSRNCVRTAIMSVPRYRSDYRLVDSGERVRVVTRMSSSGDTGTALSILNIDEVHLTDKGNYTCKPASGGQASISLHVLEGGIWNIIQNVTVLSAQTSESSLQGVSLL